MTEISTVIVGTKYRGNQAIEAVAQMRAGVEVTLRRDKANKYDPYAVECHFLGRMVGFIPRQANPAIAEAIDSGVVVTAVVREPPRVLAGKIKIEPKITVRWGE